CGGKTAFPHHLHKQIEVIIVFPFRHSPASSPRCHLEQYGINFSIFQPLIRTITAGYTKRTTTKHSSFVY
ncbi:hypothetical protein, partial [Klebsiella pneumoniae]|uniref:hypothetical protein n=1 Tax=Klebsiella pneumoniae TaxID=573 RepID=UPI00356B6B41